MPSLPSIDIDPLIAAAVVVAYCQLPAEEARNYHPTVVVLGEDNEVLRHS